MREVSERVFWPNLMPDATSDGYEKWVRDYENCEENNEQIVGGVGTKKPTRTPTTEW